MKRSFNYASRNSKFFILIVELRASIALIKRGGMGLRNIELVRQTAFIPSMAASSRSLTKAFPSWLQLGPGGEVTQVDHQSCSPPQPSKLLKQSSVSNKGYQKFLSDHVAH